MEPRDWQQDAARAGDAETARPQAEGVEHGTEAILRLAGADDSKGREETVTEALVRRAPVTVLPREVIEAASAGIRPSS